MRLSTFALTAALIPAVVAAPGEVHRVGRADHSHRDRRRPALHLLRSARGTRSGHPRRQARHRVHRGSASRRRRRAWRERLLLPDGADRRREGGSLHDQGDRERQGEHDAPVARRRRGVRGICRGAEQRARRARLRRLRCGRARVQVGRLQGNGSQGKDPARARERSAGDGCRAEAVRWEGDDVLRPLDLQVRGGRAARRSGHADRAHDGIRELSVAHGGGIVERRAANAPARPIRSAAARHARLDHRQRGDGAAQGRRARHGAASQGRRIARLQTREHGDHHRLLRARTV